jgi:hypothetical protein
MCVKEVRHCCGDLLTAIGHDIGPEQVLIATQPVRCRARNLLQGLVCGNRGWACWVVERTFSWFGRNRRLAKENLTETLATFVTLASIQLALRRLARA